MGERGRERERGRGGASGERTHSEESEGAASWLLTSPCSIADGPPSVFTPAFFNARKISVAMPLANVASWNKTVSHALHAAG